MLRRAVTAMLLAALIGCGGGPPSAPTLPEPAREVHAPDSTLAAALSGEEPRAAAHPRDLARQITVGERAVRDPASSSELVAAGAWTAQVAYRALTDRNPFQNPYVRDDLVLPELASAYLDRDDQRPGMVREGGPVVPAFDAAGWTWGGRWSLPKDPTHFSATGG